MSSKQHILVVEDEKHLAIGIKYNLEAEGFRVTTASDGKAALRFFEEQGSDLDLIILDLMLPEVSGYTVCETLRESGANVPVLILSARTLAEDRTRGFEVGADQYLTKPFDLDELLSRVRNLLSLYARRTNRSTPVEKPLEIFTFAGATVNFTTHDVVVGDESLRMTQLEMKLLEYFVKNADRIIPRSELLENVWGIPGHLTTRAPDQFLLRLRKYFEPDPANPRHFLTIRDAGYRFIAEPDGD